MVTRLSTQLIHTRTADSMMHSRFKSAEREQRMTTQQRLLQSADDPAAATETLQLNQSQARLEQYKTARSFSQHKMQSQLQTVGEMDNIAREIKQTFVAAANQSIMSDDERQIYANKLEGLKAQLVGLANGKDSSGNYLFAGYKIDTAPLVDNNGQITYQGGQRAIKQHIDVDREVTINFTAQQVLQPAAGNDIFATLDLAIDTLKTPYQSASSQAQDILKVNIDSAHHDLDSSIKTLASVTSQLGLQLKEIEQLDNHNEDLSLLTKERLSQLNDVDMIAEISEYYQEMMVLQASNSLFAEMKNLSLFKILS